MCKSNFQLISQLLKYRDISLGGASRLNNNNRNYPQSLGDNRFHFTIN